jgi:hypothetical protein
MPASEVGQKLLDEKTASKKVPVKWQLLVLKLKEILRVCRKVPSEVYIL